MLNHLLITDKIGHIRGIYRNFLNIVKKRVKRCQMVDIHSSEGFNRRSVYSSLMLLRQFQPYSQRKQIQLYNTDISSSVASCAQQMGYRGAFGSWVLTEVIQCDVQK